MTWETRPLGKLCKLVNGKAFKAAEWSESGLPIIRIQNLKDPAKPFNYWDGSLERQIRVRKGELLIAWSGTPGTSFGAHIWGGPEGVLNQHIFRVDLDDEVVTKDWLQLCVNTQLLRLIDQAHGGVGLKHVTKGAVESLKIPLPPLPEQRRIAAILDKADAVGRKRQQTLDLADQFLRSAFLHLFGDPVTNPKRWPVKKLEDLIDQTRGISYGIVQRGTDTDDGVPVVRISNIATNSFVPTPLVRAEEAIAAKYQRTFLRGGELLVSIRGTVGRVAIAPSEAKDWNVSREIAVVPIDSDLSLNYLHHALLADAAQRFMLGEVRGIAQRGINLRDLRDLPIPMPGQTELDQWDELLRTCDCVRSAEQNHSNQLEDLAGVLAQRAFRGGL